MIRERLKYLFFHVHNDWQIGLIKTDLNNFIFSNSSNDVKWINCNFDVYQADPFAIEKDGFLYVFYEEFIKAKDYATIKCSIYDHNLIKIDDRTILDDGTHKSFPFIIQVDGTFYLMPESGALEKLILYESIEFPFKWSLKKVILNFACSDAILHKANNLWYLYYTKSNQLNENDILYMRFSNDLFCDWDNQIEYVVKNDSYNARNAGSIYKIGDSNFRFAQNCSTQYGQSVIVNELSTFSDQQFEETFVLEKNLSSKNNGFHTVNATEHFILVDRRIYRTKLKSIKSIIQQLFKRFGHKI